METLTFWYHPQGEDCNGNFGPGPFTPGWISVTVPDTGDGWKDTDAAVALFSEGIQKRIRETLREWNKENIDHSASCIREFIELTCGWGVPWTLACEDWDEMEGLQ